MPRFLHFSHYQFTITIMPSLFPPFLHSCHYFSPYAVLLSPLEPFLHPCHYQFTITIIPALLPPFLHFFSLLHHPLTPFLHPCHYFLTPGTLPLPLSLSMYHHQHSFTSSFILTPLSLSHHSLTPFLHPCHYFLTLYHLSFTSFTTSFPWPFLHVSSYLLASSSPTLPLAPENNPSNLGNTSLMLDAKSPEPATVTKKTRRRKRVNTAAVVCK